MENKFSFEQKINEFNNLPIEEKNNALLDELSDIQKQEEENEKLFSQIEEDLFTTNPEIRSSYEALLKKLITEKNSLDILRKEIYKLLDLVNKNQESSEK